MKKWSCEFGFLLEPKTIQSEYVSFDVKEDYKEKLAFFKDREHWNYYYGPQTWMASLDHNTGKMVDRKNTIHTCTHWSLPTSHNLRIHHSIEGDPKYGLGAFVLYYLGFLFGSRVQFSDWLLVGRFPLKKMNWFWMTRCDVLQIIDLGIDTFIKLNAENQTRLINALYVYNRSYGAIWGWEQFSQQYMVFDALWKILWKEKGKRPAHGKRITILSNLFGLVESDQITQRTEEIVRLRNNLFHECMWKESMPDHSTDNDEPFLINDFYKLLDRIISSMLIGENTLTKTDWTSIHRSDCLGLITNA